MSVTLAAGWAKLVKQDLRPATSAPTTRPSIAPNSRHSYVQSGMRGGPHPAAERGGMDERERGPRITRELTSAPIAVIGAGPAGLTAAHVLARREAHAV